LPSEGKVTRSNRVGCANIIGHFCNFDLYRGLLVSPWCHRQFQAG
jgi:hypothetical protein